MENQQLEVIVSLFDNFSQWSVQLSIVPLGWLIRLLTSTVLKAKDRSLKVTPTRDE
jgi:hypothetical protein